ncbi:LysR family transcriptional regulator [Gilvimarinus sp. 1_MG-2023]|uniref:LysR family transcriptional regulator n=1 Tax=Gilvimarinus sp. 1_MG-2023 TaxID=3062638 RepID=UPI0026E32FA8|nr:LysR family transcriptional regulator [Gilvimarinus sp. 1_MG-2023]MDO6747316.1 LysR family transcriptional regulator [Gilvimarinus sp. 1_MG-2023]
MINTVWLRTFCTLAQVGHFTQTAHRLHMTQSGVSQHIGKLEAQLEVALILRQGKGFTLSEAGKRLYRDAGEILQALANLETQIGQDPAYEGVVRVMSPGSVGLKLYPQMLSLQAEHAKLVIEYRFAPNADIERSVADASADVGFITRESAHADISCEPIATESLLLVTPADFDQPSWQGLNTLGFIDHPDGSHHARLLLGANYPEFEHAGLIPKQGFSNQISMILEPVSLGLGFTVLPAHAVAAFARPDKIKIHSLPVPVVEPLYLCVPRHRLLPNSVQTVIVAAKKWL